MDEDCIDSNEPIFELASECEQLFSQHVSRLKDEADANATKAVGEFQQRFSAWAAFLGVFAVPELCLDRKLQHHAEVQDLVLRLMDVMKRNLTYLFEAHDISSSIAEHGALGRPKLLRPSAAQRRDDTIMQGTASDPGVKTQRPRRTTTAAESFKSLTIRRATVQRQWGSDEDPVRELGLAVEPGLREQPDTPSDDLYAPIQPMRSVGQDRQQQWDGQQQEDSAHESGKQSAQQSGENGDDIEPTDSDPASPPRSHLRISVESLRGIEGAIERLHHLSSTIKLSSEASQASRIGRFATRFDSSSFEQLARLAIGSFYSDASPSLLEHVARAMTDMYHKFHYRRSRRARLQARPPVTLPSINEEPASSQQARSWTANPAPLPTSPSAMVFDRQGPPPIVRSHLGARSHQSRDSKPTSLDSQEFKRHYSQLKDGSVRIKTRSILAKQISYPPQSEDSLICDWCFSPLSEDESKGEKWRKHINEDFKPFVCISESCLDPLRRFANSRAWFSHMLETHGQHWHRQVHLPAWYICPLCNTQDTTYPKAADLEEHIVELHGDVFTEKQSQIIAHQSRLRAPRSQDICPLCCLSMNDGQESDEDDRLKATFPTFSVPDDQYDENRKRIRSEAGTKQQEQQTDTDDSSTDLEAPDAEGPSAPSRRPLHVETIAKHIGSHLQGIMLLTLRMMTLEFNPDMSVDDKSLSGGTDDGLSRFGSTRQLSQHEAHSIETRDQSWIRDEASMDIDDPFSEDAIPDCENEVDWQDVILNDEPSPEADTFLQQMIDSGAFQTTDRLLSSSNATSNIRQQQRLHPQRGVIIRLPLRRDPFFTGHRILLHHLIQRCSAPPSRIALVGLGGIGKSHIAIELAHQIVLSGDASVFWIRADTQSSIEEGFEGIASNTSSWRTHKADTSLKLAFDWLSDKRNGRWLIILDDVNMNSLRYLHDNTNLLQSQNGTILVTTRLRSVGYKIAGNRDNVFEVEPLTVFDALALLRRKLGPSEEHSWKGPRSTSDFLKSLGLSPLTICRAAAYIQSTQASDDENSDSGDSENQHDDDDEDDVVSYVDSHIVYSGSYAEPSFSLPTYEAANWRERQEEEKKQRKARRMMARLFKQLLDNEQEKIKLLEFEPSTQDGSGGTLDSILTVWRTSFDAIRSERPSAAALLYEMSFYDRRGIPRWLLELDIRNGIGPSKGAPSLYELNSDIETLLNHCLISPNGTKDIFSMQGLMQLAVKAYLDESTRQIYEFVSVTGLRVAIPRDIYSNWTTYEELFAHIQEAANRQPTNDRLLGHWASLLYHAARFARAQGKYEVAMQMNNQAREAIGRSKRKDVVLAHTSSLMALILMDQGLYDRAEDLLTQVANACKEDANLIGDAKRTTSMNNLACIYKLKGRWKEAEAVLAETTRNRRTEFGEGHPRTLSSMANLASLSKAHGRYHEAHELLRRVFVGYTANLGPDHPHTLASMHDLGSIHRLLGNLEEAERYQKQAHESRGMIFGKDHPDTLASMNGLASTYRLQGRLQEAETLQEQTLEARKRVLGLDHPSTLASMNNLAVILYDQGKYGQASKLQSQLADACKEKLGPEHPHTLTAMNNLAVIWRNKTGHGVARWTMQDCVEARRRVLGPEHPYTIASGRIMDSWIAEDGMTGGPGPPLARRG